jgi:hypothetical protein
MEFWKIDQAVFTAVLKREVPSPGCVTPSAYSYPAELPKNSSLRSRLTRSQRRGYEAKAPYRALRRSSFPSHSRQEFTFDVHATSSSHSVGFNPRRIRLAFVHPPRHTRSTETGSLPPFSAKNSRFKSFSPAGSAVVILPS